MVYYSVLKDIIGRPTTKRALINSIIKKAASIVSEYGIDYILENNKDHYFDIDDNEIIILSIEPIINYDATDVFNIGWEDCVQYNMTENTFNVIITDDNNDVVDIGQLPYNKLVPLNKQFCDCGEAVRKGKKLLKQISEVAVKGRFIVDNYYDDLIGICYIKDTPVLCSTYDVNIPCDIIDYDYLSTDNLNFYKRNDTINLAGSDFDANKVMDLDGLTDYIFKFICKHDKKLSVPYYKDVIKRNNDDIESYVKDNDSLMKKLGDGNITKKERLTCELAVIENNEHIEKCRKSIQEANDFIQSMPANINNFKNRIKEAINNLNLDKQ